MQFFNQKEQGMAMKKQYSFTHIFNPIYFESEAVADDIQKHLDALEILYLAASEKRNVIEVNSKLTPEGKTDAREELKIEVKKERQKWLKTLDPLSAQISQIEDKMLLTPARSDDVVAELKSREIRDALRTWDVLEVQNVYLDAAKTGNDLLVLAIEGVPFPWKFPKENVVEQVKLARLERKFPEDSAKLADLQLGRKNLQSALQSAESDLRTQGINIAPDPVSDRAGLKVA